MIARTLKITNRLGLHARAAAKLVHVAGGFQSDITISKDGETVEAKSILGLLLLAAARGSELTLNCEGADENAALDALTELICNRFGEPD